MDFKALFQAKAELEKELGNLRQQSEKLDVRSEKTFNNMRAVAEEAERVADVAHNAKQILDDLGRVYISMI